MKKLITICFLLIGCISLSAMQTSNKNGKSSYQNHEERVKKMEDHLQIDARYYDHLSSYNANMYFVGEFLYWTAENDGWPYYIHLNEDDTPIGKIKYRSSEWKPGVRTGIGFKLPYDWDILVEFTYFKSSVTKSARTDYMVAIYAYDQFQDITSKLKIKLKSLDFSFGRPFNVGKTLCFNPYIGLRTCWLDQFGRNDFTTPSGPPTPGQPGYPAYTYFKQDHWMIGPRIGLKLDLLFGSSGLSLWGNLSGSYLYTDIDGKITSYTTPNGTTTLIRYYDLDSNFSDLKLAFQGALGLAWGGFLTDEENVALCVRIGWEANYWGDHYEQVIRFGDESNYEETAPVTMQGGIFSARFDF